MSGQSYTPNQALNSQSGRNFKIAIVYAQWHSSYMSVLIEGCKKNLVHFGVEPDNIFLQSVPGSFELISASNHIANSKSFDAIICFGILIKGETAHFEYICQGVTQGISQLNASQKTPIIFGVITAHNEQQVVDRCGGKHGHKGEEAAIAAIEMALLVEKIKAI
ncbi:MAG TPA: 6,7-dimethyl-8-ribityllumazine synthase [Bacteroidia bacterium]|nr:6,7-dimethyl-8-ribityllumazine synthase [Bacteroidia bacterium]HNT80278.1 6,7-dimethyl-8-ribityllumazine synthase [Bacteroidia bacterium]